MTARHASGLAASGGIECRLTNRRQSQRTGGNSVIRAVALLAVILIGLTGCGSSSKNQSGDTGGEPGAGTIVSDAPPANLDPSVHDASSWARGMTYRSRSGIDDDNTHVTGSVFVPKGDPPEGGYPVVALAPETIGTAADCAASLSPNLLGSSADVAALLKAGYVVFVPDYQGLGKPSDGKPVYHPYWTRPQPVTSSSTVYGRRKHWPPPRHRLPGRCWAVSKAGRRRGRPTNSWTATDLA